jgi:hypothetical protein
MNSRERYRAAVTFQGPDRVPVRHSVLPGARMKYGEELEKLLEEYPEDVRRFYLPMPRERLGERSYLDQWGVTWRATRTGEWLGVPVGHPLADLSRLSGFQWPDPIRDGDWETMEKGLGEDNHQHYQLGGGGNLFEVYQWLRGYENALCDLAEGKSEAELILDKIVEHNIKKIRRFGKLGVDAIGFGDDWGTQQDLIISPGLWRRFFKPRYGKMFDAARQYGAFVHFHSDGDVAKIVPDLVELGVNVLNIQVPVMELDWLSKELRGKVAVRGGLDRQKILPFGTPDEVRRHVQEVFGAFGSRAGGWIGDGELNADVPLENARAMFEAIRGLR